MQAWLSSISARQIAGMPTIEDRVQEVRKVWGQVERRNGSAESTHVVAVISVGIDRYIQPPDAVAVADAMGISSAAVASLNNSCCSFCTALDLASRAVSGDDSSRAIVVASSSLGALHVGQDRYGYAYGVGAVVVSGRRQGWKVVHVEHRTAGSYFGLKTIRAGAGTDFPYELEENSSSPLWPAYRRAAIELPVEVTLRALEKAGWNRESVDAWVMHQSELTPHWLRLLCVRGSTDLPNMGPVSSLAQLCGIIEQQGSSPCDRVAVVEIGLGLTVAVALLDRDGDAS